MNALDDLREKIATARAMPAPFGMVVLTADEADAVLDAARFCPTCYVRMHGLAAFEPGSAVLMRVDPPGEDEVT